jgi:hypothetical protein
VTGAPDRARRTRPDWDRETRDLLRRATPSPQPPPTRGIPNAGGGGAPAGRACPERCRPRPASGDRS